MNLLSVRDLNSQDPVGGLGKRKPRPEEIPQPPAPLTPTSNPQVFIDPEGKLVTKIPENERAKFAPFKPYAYIMRSLSLEDIVAGIYYQAFNQCGLPDHD